MDAWYASLQGRSVQELLEEREAETRGREDEDAFHREIAGITARRRGEEAARKAELEDVRTNLERPEYREVIERVVRAASGKFDTIREAARTEFMNCCTVWSGDDLEALAPLDWDTFVTAKREIESRVARGYGRKFRATYSDEQCNGGHNDVRGRAGGLTVWW